MDKLKSYGGSDDSDEETKEENPSASGSDFFGLSNQDDETAQDYTICEHDVLVISDDSCWKCLMNKYEQENLQKRKQSYGPLRRKQTSSLDKPYQDYKEKKRAKFNEIPKNEGIQESKNFRRTHHQNNNSEDHNHNRCVTELQWHPLQSSSHLLLSCSMDGTIKIWDITKRNGIDVILDKSVSKTAVRSAKWSNDGEHIVTGDFDCKLKMFNVSTEQQEINISHNSFVTYVGTHPSHNHLLISGSHKNIQCWDTRIQTNDPVHSFHGHFGQVRDLIFLKGNLEFICCTDTVERESADRAIMAWHFESGALLSNQIYQERYSCPALKVHPTESVFLAQTNGNYIAMFSALHPYKMNKNKRFDNHKVAGYGVGFDMSSDGRTVISGSADGTLSYYNYYSGKHFRTRTVFESDDPCIPVRSHPFCTSTVAVGSWSGRLQLLR